MIDLACITADQSIAAAMEEVLSRSQAVGMRPIAFEVRVHPERDPGCFHDPDKLLQGYSAIAAHALVVLDRAWDGAPPGTAEDLERLLEAALAQRHAPGWARAIVIDPELESWVFSGSPHVAGTLGWTGSTEDLRSTLQAMGLWEADCAKPRDPKRAMDWVLRQARIPRSSSLFRTLAAKVSFQRCVDRAFLRLLGVLRGWFVTTEPQ